MLDRRDVIYLYDGSFDGLLTSVFDAFLNHTDPLGIEVSENGQLSLMAQYYHVETDEEKSRRVSDKIIKVSSAQALRQIFYTFLSVCPEKEYQIFNYIRACLKYGYKVDRYMTLDCVNAVLYSSQKTSEEAHKYTGFVRFSLLENGVYYSQIQPKNNVLPIITHHFVTRYRSMPFIIHDTQRMECLIYNGKTSAIFPTDSIPQLKLSQDEKQYRRLWREFYDSVEIKERHNDRQRMTCMPKRYWRNLTELNEYN